MESYGAHCVYVIDSGGALTMNDVARARARLPRRRSTRRPRSASTPTTTSSLGVANSVVAVEEGATASTPRSPAWAPAPATPRSRCSSPSPNRKGWQHGCDLFALMDAADDLVRPLQDRPVRVDRETLSLGYAGVYSSFLRHAEHARRALRRRHPHILIELGRRRMVGGQEDMIVDVALDLAKDGGSI